MTILTDKEYRKALEEHDPEWEEFNGDVRGDCCTEALLAAQEAKTASGLAIPTFPNEVGGNPVIAIEVVTDQGVRLRFNFTPPVQQSRMMIALGHLHAAVGAEGIDLTLP